MQIPILVEPIESGRFRACAGQPFSMYTEADTRDEAVQTLQRLIEQRLHNGAEVRFLTVTNGASQVGTRFPGDELFKPDWTYYALQEEIAKNRQAEDAEEAARP